MKFVGYKDESRFQTEIRELVTGISILVFISFLAIPLGLGTFSIFSYLDSGSVIYVSAISYVVVGAVSAYIASLSESAYTKREFLDSLDEDYEWKIEEKEDPEACKNE